MNITAYAYELYKTILHVKLVHLKLGPCGKPVGNSTGNFFSLPGKNRMEH